MDVDERMRDDWNIRAKEDAYSHVASGLGHLDEKQFFATGVEPARVLEQELARLPPASAAGRRALDIGCGPGRLMLPMSRHFREIHGVDVAEEMLSLARQLLKDLPNAYFHLTSGSDLRMFMDDYFDFVYSYVVFQHIPSREIVVSYLREAQRVLKPGGILCCQIRGVAPPASETRRGPDTWVGCHFTADDMSAFARQQRFPLVAITGIDTQYMWTTFRKATYLKADRPPGATKVLAVTATAGREQGVPTRGPWAAISLWMDGFPANGDLACFPVSFDGVVQMGCYLSPVGETGGCQMDVRLPQDLKPGRVGVQLLHVAHVGDLHTIEVLEAAPLTPRLVSVTDGMNLTAHFRTETRGVKVSIEGIDAVQQVSFLVGDRPVESLDYECRDPITSRYEFAFRISDEIGSGVCPLVIRISGRTLERIPLEVDLSKFLLPAVAWGDGGATGAALAGTTAGEGRPEEARGGSQLEQVRAEDSDPK